MLLTKRVATGLSIIIFGVVGIMLVSVRPVWAENPKESNPGGQNQLVRVCTLNSVEANQEFQRNVQVVKAQRQHIIGLQTQLAQAQTDDLKKALQEELDQALEKLNENNKKMVETYGFSLNRNYVLVTEKAHVYMIVSKEEAAKIKEPSTKE